MLRLSIRRKLAIALAVPLTALVMLTVLEMLQTARAAARVSAQTELARAAIGPSGIITALQNERAWLGALLVGQQDAVSVPVRGTDETRAQTNAAIDAFRDEIARRDTVVREAFRPGLQDLDELDEIRAHFDTESGPRALSNIGTVDDAFARYTALIEPFFQGTTRVALVIDDLELRLGAELADVVARQSETFAVLVEKTISVATISPGGVDTPDEISEIARLQSDFRRYAAILRDPSGPYAAFAAEHFPADQTARVDEQIDAAITTGRIDLPVLVDALGLPDDEAYTGYMRALHAEITDRADNLRSTAEARQLWFSALAGLALLGAIALTVQVSRSITRPLQSLTHQAKDMAERRLPGAVLDVLETPLGDDVQVPRIKPVTVQTRDEVADVADALNTVQESALDLAVEQAVLRRNIADSFVNLGRRNQNLLGRQLDFITELESRETDPDTLASLFRLDHLATRMRRNAESLLVLAGIEPARRWAAPVRLTDVVRAALSEVEDYHRVTVHGVEPATVVGSAAADLAHLIAELLENALTFSPPGQRVEIRGLRRRDPDGYELAIVDTGFGMPPADLERANRRLAGTESFTVAPSRYLGHYVAGNLATRHGIAIRLDPTPGQGTTASIDLPPELLTPTDPVPAAGSAPVAGSAVGPPDACSAPVGRPRGWPADAPWKPRPVPALPTPNRPTIPHTNIQRTAPGPVERPDEPSGPNAPGSPGWDRRSVPATSATTAGGLERRVPGAQLPATEPVLLRRDTAARPTAPAPVARHDHQHSPAAAAQDVYDFLTSFRAGIQRGLDEAGGAIDLRAHPRRQEGSDR